MQSEQINHQLRRPDIPTTDDLVVSLRNVTPRVVCDDGRDQPPAARDETTARRRTGGLAVTPEGPAEQIDALEKILRAARLPRAFQPIPTDESAASGFFVYAIQPVAKSLLCDLLEASDMRSRWITTATVALEFGPLSATATVSEVPVSNGQPGGTTVTFRLTERPPAPATGRASGNGTVSGPLGSGTVPLRQVGGPATRLTGSLISEHLSATSR